MDAQDITLDELGQDLRTLTLESMNMKGAWDNVKNALPSFLSKVREFSRLRNQRNASAVQGIASPNRRVAGIDFTAVMYEKVLVPQGLNDTFLNYMGTLSKGQDFIDTLLPNSLVPTDKFLANLLSDVSEFKSQRNNPILEMIAKRDIESLSNDMSKHFSKEAREFWQYGKVVDRQSDWPVVITEFNKLSDRYNSIRRDDVFKMIEQIGDSLDALIERIQEDPETYRPSGVTLKNLSIAMYALASEVEYYAIHGAKMEVLRTSLNAVADMLKKKG